MAGADYRSCDVCGGKTFYDANLSYDFETYPEHGLRLGDWKVICEDCAKSHKCVIVNIETPNIIERLKNENSTLREALTNLLDVFERCEAGFPPEMELRFLARDLAKAALPKESNVGYI